MKKITLLILTITLLAACAPKEQTAEEITREMNAIRTEISDLTAQLATLENTLETLEPIDADQGIKVTVEPLRFHPFESFVKTSAVIEAVNEAMVTPQTNGKILTIHVEKGDKVAKGQRLVTLDDEIISRSLEEMKTGLELTKTLFDKQKDLYDQGVGSEMQFLEVKNRYESMLKSKETLESQIDLAVIKAPFPGYVEDIFQKVGEVAAPGRQMIHLVNLSDLYIKTDLSENYLGAVKEKDTVWVQFPHFPDWEETARISQIGKTIHPGSRTFSLRVEMKNEGERLKPNMLAAIQIRDYYQEKALVLPTRLIRQDPNGSFVYVARHHDGDSFAAKTYVKAGRSNGIETEIISGIEPGDQVITGGFNQVRDGNKVLIVN